MLRVIGGIEEAASSLAGTFVPKGPSNESPMNPSFGLPFTAMALR
jgi:hypothetical protein